MWNKFKTGIRASKFKILNSLTVVQEGKPEIEFKQLRMEFTHI
jgi:hypothetical protein